MRVSRVRHAVAVAAVATVAFAAGFAVVFAVAQADDAAAAASPYRAIWLSQAELDALPTTGAAYQQAKAAADGPLGTPDIADQDSDHDVRTLAAALLYQATGQDSYRAKAADGIAAAIGTEDGGRTLALARNLTGYVIAADLIALPAFRPSDGARFQTWLAAVRDEDMSDGRSLREMRETRANNWGTNAGAALAAANAYLGDTTALAREAQVFRGWLGDRSSYAGFSYGGLSWQADPGNPVGVNPTGATIQGRNVDGVLPDDQRRAGGFTWPPPCENYVWGALGPALVETAILARAGYTDAPTWSNSALERALRWVTVTAACPAQGDDVWAVWLGNHLYGTSYPAAAPAAPGKPMAWTDWTHAEAATDPPPTTTTEPPPATTEPPTTTEPPPATTTEPPPATTEPPVTTEPPPPVCDQACVDSYEARIGQLEGQLATAEAARDAALAEVARLAQIIAAAAAVLADG